MTRQPIMTAVAAIVALAATQAWAGEQGGGPTPRTGGHECGGGCRPSPSHPGPRGPGSWDSDVHVDADASASAHATAEARSHLEGRSHAVGGQRGASHGGTIYVGGGGFEAGESVMRGGASYAAIETLGPAPVNAPFGYAVNGMGRRYIGWRPSRRLVRDGCGCDRHERGGDRRLERTQEYSRSYGERAYEEHGYGEPRRRSAAFRERARYRSERRVVAPAPVYVESPPVYVEPAHIYVLPPEVHFAPPVVHYAPPVHVRQPPVYIQPPAVHVDAPEVYVAAPDVHLQPPEVVMAPPVHVPGPPVVVQAPPVYISPPPVHVAPSEVFVAPDAPAPPPPPMDYYGDEPPPGHVAPVAPPRHTYRQEVGERG